jgi:hypothetical protein
MIILFGDEDQLRIMCMKKGSNLLEVFTNLNEMLTTVESIDGIHLLGCSSRRRKSSASCTKASSLSWQSKMPKDYALLFSYLLGIKQIICQGQLK